MRIKGADNLTVYVKELKKAERAETNSNPESFIQFYGEELKSKFEGSLSELFQTYKDWSSTRNLDPISCQKCVSVLKMLSHAPKSRSGSRFYDLRESN